MPHMLKCCPGVWRDVGTALVLELGLVVEMLVTSVVEEDMDPPLGAAPSGAHTMDSMVVEETMVNMPGADPTSTMPDVSTMRFKGGIAMVKARGLALLCSGAQVSQVDGGLSRKSPYHLFLGHRKWQVEQLQYLHRRSFWRRRWFC